MVKQIGNFVELDKLSTDDIMSAYSGIDGRCACGCSGKYAYNSKHRIAASKNRGYTVDDEDINDRQVKRILNIIKKAALVEQGTPNANTSLPSYISTVDGRRRYTLYLVGAR